MVRLMIWCAAALFVWVCLFSLKFWAGLAVGAFVVGGEWWERKDKS